MNHVIKISELSKNHSIYLDIFEKIKENTFDIEKIKLLVEYIIEFKLCDLQNSIVISNGIDEKLDKREYNLYILYFIYYSFIHFIIYLICNL